jgi:hypothetical protein
MKNHEAPAIESVKAEVAQEVAAPLPEPQPQK